ncbi:MAG: hypothetical protein ACK56F_03135, partial [bacterium]
SRVCKCYAISSMCGIRLMGHLEENLNLGSDPAVPSSSHLHQALAFCTRSLGPLIGKITEHGHVLCIF